MEKSFVESLYKEKARNDSNSEDLANTLNILSKTVFGDINRFVFELLQNADDSPHPNNSSNLDVVFHLLDDYLLFYHNGKHFDNVDVKGISRVGSHDSRKDKELEKTGYKGIGFKSVFNTSDCVQIISNGFNFKFDKNHHIWSEDRSYPWQVIPIWSDTIPDEVRKYISLENVNTIIKIHNKETIYSEILNVFEDCQIILFLRNINSIRFFKNDNQEFEIHKQKTDENTFNLYYNQYLKSSWYVSSFNIEINGELRNKLAMLSDEECPVKLKEARRTKMTFAALIHDGKLTPLDETIIYNYLPTKVDFSFPFIVNGDFITNAERTQLLVNDWNKFLLKSVATIQLEWFVSLNSTKFKFDILQLLKSKFSFYSNSPLKEAYNSGFTEAINSIAFIPDNTDSKLLKADSCLIDSLGYSKFFPQEHILNLFQKNLTLVNPNLIASEGLMDIGALVFNENNLEELLNSSAFKSLSINDYTFNYKVICFLYKKIEANDFLKKQNFILDNLGQLHAPENLFFPSESLPTQITFTELSFIDRRIFNELNKHKEIIEWLVNLDLKFPKNIEILRKSVFNMIFTDVITEKNSIVIIRFIYKLYKRGELTDNDYKKIRKIKLLTNNGMQPASNIYLSDSYNPILKIEQLAPEQNYLSSTYVEVLSEYENWKSFFLKLHVKEKITVVKYSKTERNKLISYIPDASSYLSWIDSNGFYDNIYYRFRNSGQHSVSDFRYFYFLNHLSTYEFAILFWDILLNDWNSYGLESPKTRYHYYGGNSEIPDYLSFYVKNHISIPAIDNKSYKSVDVYAPRFKSIIKDKFPVANFKSSLLTKEQINYLGLKQFLEINNCITILESLVSSEIDGEIKKQFFAIYGEILKSHKEGNRITKDISHIKLLSLNNTFQSVKNLYHFNVSSLKAPVNSEDFIQFPDTVTTKDRELLCAIFNIIIVNYNDLAFNYSNKQVDGSLKDKLKEILPYLAVIVSHKESDSFELLYSRLDKKLSITNIYKADLLSLLYKGKDDTIIFDSGITTWHEDNSFYFSGNWSSPLTIYTLCTLWCSYLEIENIDRELALFLQISKEEIIDWLIERGYEIPSISEKNLINYPVVSEEEDEVTVARESSYDDSYNEPLIVEVFEPEVEPENADTANVKVANVTSESINYSSFSESHSKLSNEDTKIDIGRWSEEYMFIYFKNNSNYTSVNWINKEKEAYQPYDFIVVENQVEKYIEVKGTPSKDKGEFYMSKNEWKFMFEKKTDYFIYRLFNAGKKEGLELKIISKPYLLIENGIMLPDSIAVYI